MRVELRYAELTAASTAADGLATDIDAAVRGSRHGAPLDLPDLAPLATTSQWLRDESVMLDELAAVALLLDAEGTGHVTLDVTGVWDSSRVLQDAATSRFGPDFVEATGLEGEELTRLLTTLASVGTDTSGDDTVMSPDQLRRFIIAHPDVASALQSLSPRGGGPAGDLHSLTMPFVTTPGGSQAVWDQRRIDLRELFASLPPDEAAILAMTYPSVVGNLSGVPFENRADANTVNVVAALARERDDLAGLREQHEHNQGDWDFLGLNNDDLDGPIADLEDRIALYESILADDRQILYFDPADDGAIAELHGTIDSGTDNVGVLVPGTTSDLASFQGNADRSESFQEADPTGGLSMITWMGGDLPDSVLQDAPFAHYANDLGPHLTNFSHDLRQEIEHADTADAQVTMAGHSYGGAVVGRAELSGLDADRVLHIESAGVGHDVRELSDLPASQHDIDRYSMTAPGDPIALSQGVQAGDLGHGADPDTFADTTRLHTGNLPDGTFNTGTDAHTAVFTPGGDAWQNMYEVFTGGSVETYRSPDYHTYSTGRSAVTVQEGWNDDGERVDID